MNVQYSIFLLELFSFKDINLDSDELNNSLRSKYICNCHIENECLFGIILLYFELLNQLKQTF